MSSSGSNLAGCATCSGQCCRNYLVIVNAAEVQKLAEATFLRPADFIYLHARKENEPGFRLRPGGLGNHLALQKKQPGERRSACVFLAELAPGVARCGVYAHRPRVCSTFPTKLENGIVSVRQDTTCGSDAWNVAAMNLPRYRRDLTAQRASWQEHWRIVEKWNAEVDADGRERKPDDLFDHLLLSQGAAEPGSEALA